jgi:hypothetical protein
MIISRIKPKNLEKNLPQYHFVHNKSHLKQPGYNLGLCAENSAFMLTLFIFNEIQEILGLFTTPCGVQCDYISNNRFICEITYRMSGKSGASTQQNYSHTFFTGKKIYIVACGFRLMGHSVFI